MCTSDQAEILQTLWKISNLHFKIYHNTQIKNLLNMWLDNYHISHHFSSPCVKKAITHNMLQSYPFRYSPNDSLCFLSRPLHITLDHPHHSHHFLSRPLYITLDQLHQSSLPVQTTAHHIVQTASVITSCPDQCTAHAQPSLSVLDPATFSIYVRYGQGVPFEQWLQTLHITVEQSLRCKTNMGKWKSPLLALINRKWMSNTMK